MSTHLPQPHEELRVLEPPESKVAPQRGSSRLIALTVAFVLMIGGWAFVTSKLTSAPREKLGPIENRLRGNSVTMAVLPEEVYSTRPPWLDLVHHFVAYFPFGLMAYAAGEIMRRWRGERSRLVAVCVMIILALGWAVFDEYRQIALPDRSADWDDLFAGWLGIISAASACLSLSLIWGRRRKTAAKS